MTNDAKLVLQGFFELTESDKGEVAKVIEEYVDAATSTKRASLKEGFKSTARTVLGPVSSSCPCCGK